MQFSHKPVLFNQVINSLAIKPDSAQLFVDGTCGGGGHSLGILKASDRAELIAIDKDEDALIACRQRLDGYGGRVDYRSMDFKEAAEKLTKEGIRADGVLLDLGVSSFQLDNYSRGFSYRATEQLLDMRMDRRQEKSAYTVINGYPQQELASVIYRYGEEKFSRRIADNIVKRREIAPIKTCGELTEIIYASIPAAARRTGGNPAKRTFQALRIEVNDELTGLAEAAEAFAGLLKPGGRLSIITFHSLEDRIIKQVFRKMSITCTCPPKTPVCICGAVAVVTLIGGKPITADERELAENPRSASAKLRVCQKI